MSLKGDECCSNRGENELQSDEMRLDGMGTDEEIELSEHRYGWTYTSLTVIFILYA